MIKVCFCPDSIKWILKHLNKSARKTFRQMIKSGSIKSVKKSKHRKRKFSPAQLRAQRLFAQRSKAGTLR